MTSTVTTELVGGTTQAASTAQEEWRDIPGMEGHYAASSWGRIRSYKRSPEGHIIKLTPAGVGQGRNKPQQTCLTFTPYMDGAAVGMSVSRAVCLAFHGQPDDPRRLAQHISLDLHDNRPENLRWGN